MNRIGVIFTFTGLICLLPLAFGLAAPVVAKPYMPDLENRMDEYISSLMTDESVPGAAAVVVEGGRTVYARGFGITGEKSPEPVNQHTVFDMASVSKSFTALGVLMLRDRGLIELDRPVVDYLPGFGISGQSSASSVSVRHLLTHTSGIPGSLAEPQGYFNGPDAFALMVDELADVQLNNPPGTVFEYSNLNYFLLGALIEAVSGLPFEQYMYKNVFEPLGLERTTLYPEQAETWGRAYGHQSVFGRVVERSMPFYRSAAPAGWVMSNAADMGRWLSLFINNGRLDERQLVPAGTIQEMLTPQVFYEKDGHKVGYGIGWLIATDSHGITRYWHGGDTPSFLADILVLPGYDVGVAVMLNSQTSVSGHLIAPTLAGIYLDMELEQMASPWWAHWKTIDTMSFGGLSLAALLFAGLVLYVWRTVNKIRRGRYIFVKPRVPARWLPAWQLSLLLAPLALLGVLTLTGYLTVDSLYGYNIFTVMSQTLLVVPTSTWATGMSVLGMVLVWSITLALVAFTVRRNPDRQ